MTQSITWSVELTIIGRIALSMALGAVIGFEREIARRAAGLRTHMLIAGAAALIVGVGQLLSDDFSDEHFRELVRIDPLRLIEAVVAAVGFVGAGSIIRRPHGQEIAGLTTAAGLLMAAGIGITVGVGHLPVGFAACCLTVMTLYTLNLLEHRLNARR